MRNWICGFVFVAFAAGAFTLHAQSSPVRSPERHHADGDRLPRLPVGAVARLSERPRAVETLPLDGDDPRHAGVAGRAPRRSARAARRGRRSVPIGEGFLADAERYLDTIRRCRRGRNAAGTSSNGRALRRTATRRSRRPTFRAQRDRWLTVGPKRVFVKGTGLGAAADPAVAALGQSAAPRARESVHRALRRRAESGPRRAGSQ
jgi:hypothetical protein